MLRTTMASVRPSTPSPTSRAHTVDECSLFGGEPLLASNRATVQAIARRAHDAGLTIAAVTNGYDLDVFLDLMEECEFSSLQVTVDGVREVHDRRRVHLSDGRTYDRILRNIGLALDRGVKVSVCVNVDRHNLAGMRDLVADFAERGLVDETHSGRDGFSYYFKATEGDEGSDWCVSEREILDELLHMGFSAGEAIEREGQYLMFASALHRTLRKESLPPIQTAFCGAETGTAVVDPFGRLFTCIDRVTYDDAVVGRLNEEEGCFDWTFLRAKWRTRTSDLLRRCQACPYVFACQGGCASQAKRMHGTYFREECGSMPETFDYVASHAAGGAWAREGDDELSLSWAEPLTLLGDEGRQAIMGTTDESQIVRMLENAGVPLSML